MMGYSNEYVGRISVVTGLFSVDETERINLAQLALKENKVDLDIWAVDAETLNPKSNIPPGVGGGGPDFRELKDIVEIVLSSEVFQMLSSVVIENVIWESLKMIAQRISKKFRERKEQSKQVPVTVYICENQVDGKSAAIKIESALDANEVFELIQATILRFNPSDNTPT